MENKIAQPTILVIVGISGDLSKRKLLPAIRAIHDAGIAPDQFRVIGITRRELNIADVLPDGETDFLREHLELHQMDLTSKDDYKVLAEHLAELEQEFGGDAQRLFYLSVPPQVSKPIIDNFGEV